MPARQGPAPPSRLTQAPFPLPGRALPDTGAATLCVLAALAVLALWLRVYALGEAHLWWDEFITLIRAALPPAEIWKSLASQAPSDASLDSHPPLLHILTHYLLQAGVHGSWVKAVSAVAGAGSVLAAGLLGAALFGRTAGMAAALMLALNLFHIHYSRELRAYSLYLFFALWSLWFLVQARASGRWLHWAGHGLCVVGMLYSSYLTAATLAGQGLFVVVDWLASRHTNKKAAATYLAGFTLSCLGALVCYLPWLGGYVYHMRMIRGLSSGFGLPALDVAAMFKEYAAYRFLGVFPLAVAFVAVLLSLAAAWLRNWRGALLLGLWVALSLGATVAVGSGGNVPARYLFCAVAVLALFAGALADAAARLLPAATPTGLRALAALALAGLTGLPGMAAYPSYCRPPMTETEALAHWLADNADNIDALLFSRNRHHKITTAWRLPGLFKRLGDAPEAAYLRCFLLSDNAKADHLPAAADFGSVTVRRLGLVRQAPVVLDRPYAEDFSTTRFYADAFAWQNAGPDTGFKNLSGFDPAKPGHAVYVFQAPADRFAPGLALGVSLRLKAAAQVPAPDAWVRVAAGLPGLPPLLSRTVTSADFSPPGTLTGEVALRLDLPESLARADTIEVRFDLNPGSRHGELELTGFSLDWPGSAPLPGGLARRYANLARGGALARYAPSLARAADRTVYAFSLDDALAQDLLPHGLQNAAEHAAFLADWPGIAPVEVWTSPDGKPAVGLYDPALAAPWLAPGRLAVYFGGQAAGFKARGLTSPAQAMLGASKLPLQAALPPDARLLASAGAPSVVRLDMTDPANALHNAFMAENMTADATGAEPCLRCVSDDGCFAVYAFRLPGPAESVQAVYHPYLSSLGRRPNRLGLSVSTDGTTYRPVSVFSQPRFFDWDEAGRIRAELPLDTPSTLVYLRLEMTSEESRLRMNMLKPFTLEARLQAPLPLPAAIGAEPFTPLATADQEARVFLSPAPLPR